MVELNASLRWAGDDVVVVGTGAVTAVGLDAPMTAASVRAGISRNEETSLVDRWGEPMRCALAPLDQRYGAQIRTRVLAVRAAAEALAPVLGSPNSPSTIALCLGVSAPGLALDPVDGPALVEAIEEALPVAVSASQRPVVAKGRAAGALAVAHAARLLAGRPDGVVLAGGAHSYVDAVALETLDAAGRLHSDASVDGFVPGEGAAFVALATRALAERTGWPVRAVLRSAAAGAEPNPYLSDGICIGTGLSDTLQAALSVLRTQECADWTIADLTGESFGAREWMYAYLRTGASHGEPLELWHPADCYGDLGAAAGPAALVLATEAWARGYARGPRCLIWAASDGPPRSALLVQQSA